MHDLKKNSQEVVRIERAEYKGTDCANARIYWGATKYHPQPQWLLEGFDHDKNASRIFALCDCDFTVRHGGKELTF